MEMNCQGLSIRKMYSRCMCHPGIPNRCRAVFITQRHHVNTPGADGGHSQMKTRPWNAPHFWISSVTLQRETDSTDPNLPRRQQECLHTPSRPPHGPHDLLWTSVTNSSQMDDTDRSADCSWIETLPHLYALFFCFFSFTPMHKAEVSRGEINCCSWCQDLFSAQRRNVSWGVCSWN